MQENFSQSKAHCLFQGMFFFVGKPFFPLYLPLLFYASISRRKSGSMVNPTESTKCALFFPFSCSTTMSLTERECPLIICRVVYIEFLKERIEFLCPCDCPSIIPRKFSHIDQVIIFRLYFLKIVLKMPLRFKGSAVPAKWKSRAPDCLLTGKYRIYR